MIWLSELLLEKLVELTYRRNNWEPQVTGIDAVSVLTHDNFIEIFKWGLNFLQVKMPNSDLRTRKYAQS